MAKPKPKRRKKGGSSAWKGRPYYLKPFKPFGSLPHDEVRKHLKELGEKSAGNFDQEIKELEKSIQSVNPISLLAVLGHWGLSRFLNDQGEIQERKEGLRQDHVELVQAMALRYPLNKFSKTSSRPDLVQDVWDRASHISESFHLSRLKTSNEIHDNIEQERRFIQERMRLHTQTVRNWGFAEHVVNILTELLKPLDPMFKKTFGIPLSLIFQLTYKRIDIVEKKGTEHFSKLSKVFSANDISQLAEIYYQEFPELRGTAEELKEMFRDNGFDPEQAKGFIFSHSDLKLPEIYSFTPEDFSEGVEYQIDLIALERILDRLSISFGEISNVRAEHCFLDNPCWKKPLIKLAEKKFFQPIATLLLSFPFEALEEFLQDEPQVLQAYFDRRAEFLEERIEALFRKSFPSAKVHRDNYWLDPTSGKRYQNDLLVIIDCFAIIIEAKAGRTTDPAKRGALGRLERVAEDLIESASEQSQRFAEWIIHPDNEGSLKDRHGNKKSINLSKITQTARLTVLLDDIATIQATAVDLQKAGLISNSVNLVPTMILADLEIILENLDTTPSALHYFIRVTELEHHAHSIADELDFLGFYLATAFNVGESEFDGSSFILTKMSYKIDQYFENRANGVLSKKPFLRLTTWWRDLLSQLERKDNHRWLELAIKLLNVSFEDQEEIARQFKKVKQNVKNFWRTKGHKNIVLYCTGPNKRKNAFVFLAYRQAHWDKRRDWAAEGAGIAMKNCQAKDVLVIGQNIDSTDYPYSLIGLWEADSA